jgi:hypothetical protein
LQLNIENLRRHYASLSDEALREIDRSELVEAARACYDHELAQREPLKVIRATPLQAPEEETGPAEAACVCAFAVFPGKNSAADAENARIILENAGIPCYIELHEIQPDPTPPPQSEYRVIVPSGLNLRAVSVLDKEIFNEQAEADWRTHFENLPVEELFEKKEILLGGILDRVARISKAYDEEVARRTNSA